MKQILLIIISLESLILGFLAIKKKITKKAFFIIALITAVFGIVSLLFVTKKTGPVAFREVDTKESIYVAAKLTESDKPSLALAELAQFKEDEGAEYEIRALKGLDYNLQGAYFLATTYLNGAESDWEKQVYTESMANTAVERELKYEICEGIIEKLGLSDEETDKYAAKLSLKYDLSSGNTDTEPDEEEASADNDILTQAAKLIRDRKYDDAYDLMLNEAENGDVKNGVIVSYMYSNNFHNTNLSKDDVEYDRLLEGITAAQTEKTRKVLEEMKEEESEEENAEEEKRTVNSLDELQTYGDYDYTFSLNLLGEEKAKRSINYLNQFETEEFNPGYTLELARLYFMSNDRETTDEYLTELFVDPGVDSSSWLGESINMLADIYLMEMSESNTGSFDLLFEDTMCSLYQGLFDEHDYIAFRDYIKEFLKKTYEGIIINNVDITNYPSVRVRIAPLEDVEFTGGDIFNVNDSGTEIEEFSFEKEEVSDVEICFVLDRSGSMDGSDIQDAKDAIKRTVLDMEDYVQVGLVSFESSSRIDLPLTQSKFTLTGTLSGIEASGGTNIAAGLKDGYDVLRNGAGEKIIILLSDGYDGSSNELDAVLSSLVSAGIKVYAIGLNGCDEAYLTRIATTTGGRFIMASNAGQLNSIYSNISTSIINVYYIDYTVSEEAKEEETDSRRYVQIGLKDKTTKSKKMYSTVKREEDAATVADIETEQIADLYRQKGSTKGGNR